MPSLVMTTSDDGLHLSPEALQEAGLTPGSLVEIVALPGSREIALRALGQCVRKLGDAIGVSEPTWDATAREWCVELLLSTTNETVGHLFYNVRGDLIVEKSATYESVRKPPNAASAQDPAA
jgi:hypothetical protein